MSMVILMTFPGLEYDNSTSGEYTRLLEEFLESEAKKNAAFNGVKFKAEFYSGRNHNIRIFSDHKPDYVLVDMSEKFHWQNKGPLKLETLEMDLLTLRLAALAYQHTILQRMLDSLRSQFNGIDPMMN